MTELPDGWSLESLSDVAVWGSGGTPQAGHAAFYGGDIPWAVIGDLNEATVMETRASITDAGLAASSAKLVPEGAVLLAMYGSIGKLGIAGRPMATNQAIAFALPNDRVLGKYLFYYLMSQRHQLDAAGKGATQRNISQTILRPWPIVLPEGLDEQRRIVDILEDHLSRLDAAEAILVMARLRIEGLLTAALLREVPVQTAPTEPLSALLAEPLANGRSVPTRDGGFPVLRLTALRTSEVDLSERKAGAWTETEARPYLVRRGDFLVSRGNGSLRLVARGAYVAQEPDAVAYPDTLIRVRTRSEDIDPGYMALVWNSPIVRHQIESMARTTAGIYKVNQKHLESVKIPVPSLDAQKVVSARVGEVAVAASRLGGELKLARERSRGLRQALLAAAFSGRLTGRSTDIEMVEEMAGV